MSKTNTDRKVLIEQLRRTPIVQITCEKTGVSRATYYRWRKNSPKFSKDCDQALSEGTELINDLAESQLLSAIKDKNLTAITYWLKYHHKTYETRIKLDGHITHETEVLSPEQEELVSKALRMVGLLEAPVRGITTEIHHEQ